VSGNGISWAICKSARRSRQITTPAPHHSVFLQAGCPSRRPINSVKALKAQALKAQSSESINNKINEQLHVNKNIDNRKRNLFLQLKPEYNRFRQSQPDAIRSQSINQSFFIQTTYGLTA